MKCSIFDTKQILDNKSEGKYLYHYTSLETAVEYILPKMEMRLSPIFLVNDPIEYTTNVDMVFITSYKDYANTDLDMYNNIENELIEFKNKKVKVLCFSQDNYLKLRALDNSTNLNLGRGYGKPRMWSQYANQHRGVCLVFDKEILLEECQDTYKSNIIFDSIKYQDEYELENDPFSVSYDSSTESIQEFVRNHLDKNKQNLFYMKKEDWKDENEFRIALIDNDTEFKYLSCKNSLVGIVLGDKFPMAYLECFKPYINVEIGKINWSISSVDIEKISIT